MKSILIVTLLCLGGSFAMAAAIEIPEELQAYQDDVSSYFLGCQDNLSLLQYLELRKNLDKALTHEMIDEQEHRRFSGSLSDLEQVEGCTERSFRLTLINHLFFSSVLGHPDSTLDFTFRHMHSEHEQFKFMNNLEFKTPVADMLIADSRIDPDSALRVLRLIAQQHPSLLKQVMDEVNPLGKDTARGKGESSGN